MGNIQPAKSGAGFRALIFFSGILIFMGFLQLKSPWNCFSVAGICISGAILVQGISSVNDLINLFGVKSISRHIGYFLVISILIGSFWSIVFRHYLNIPLFPERLTRFVFIAVTIGAVEELIFRGYLQRLLRNMGILVSILGASALHSLYKCSIFLILPAKHPTDYFYLFIWTFGVGCISGTLKEISGNTLVSVAGHATFDLIAYGDGLVDTWWIWM